MYRAHERHPIFTCKINMTGKRIVVECWICCSHDNVPPSSDCMNNARAQILNISYSFRLSPPFASPVAKGSATIGVYG